MRTIKMLFIFLLFCGSNLLAQEKGLFQQATTAYAEGDYEQAIAHYEQILNNGRNSVSLYYNLANAHYKLNHIAPSIYYYEKALQMAPNDEEVLNNLSFAHKMTVDAIVPKQKTDFSVLLNNYLFAFHFDTWAWISVAFSFGFAILFLAYYFTTTSTNKKRYFGGSILCLLLSVIFVATAFFGRSQQMSRKYAIVFAKEAKIKAEPNLRSDRVFTLHEGAKVKIVEQFDAWFEIRLADGKEGWIKKESVKML